jgi:flagellar basal-body rod protein FlgF
MDKLIYTSMSGAKATMDQQGAVANNLANASTAGFRSEMHRLRAVPVQAPTLPTRAFVVDATVASDFTPGPITQTGNPLDVAINGAGWLAVTASDGTEAYTRAGDLTLDANGVLTTQTGLKVVGINGEIAIGPANNVEIGADGTVSTVSQNGNPPTETAIGRMKLVNPAPASLVRGNDGLFRLAGGKTADVDSSVKLHSGCLEGSNVNMAEQMVNMIALQRNYELHIKMLSGAQDNDKAATQILVVG